MTPNQSDQSAPSASWSMDSWLAYLQSIHPSSIEMGLERVNQVFQRMQIEFGDSRIITVGGTNGKGTTCAFVEQGVLSKGQKVAVYSSPHLLDYRERVRVNGEMLSEQDHIDAFMQVESARTDISLTYFEFATLAAFSLIARQHCDVILLEVGLGGRLDAVNIVDSHIAVITSIDLDHQDWLGDTRELVALEKAGILRHSRPAVIGDTNPPDSLKEKIQALDCQAYSQGHEFGYKQSLKSWSWQSDSVIFTDLPLPHIPLQNASTSLQVLKLLGYQFEQQQIIDVIQQTSVAGRLQRVSDNPVTILDVAHNPHATRHLATEIAKLPYQQLHLIVGMLSDKDIAGSLEPLQCFKATWYVSSLDVPRGASSKTLKSMLDQGQRVVEFEAVDLAYQEALQKAAPNDLIVVFGSFFTVAGVMQVLQK